MNPFSGFLQPPTQRSPLAGAASLVNDVARLNLARQAQAQDVVQQKDSSARDWKRIGLQEAAQNRNFSDADKKEVESLLAEYQDAEDQGDPVRLDRASQMLKRFGMDVTQGAPKAKPLPGSLLPEVKPAEQDLSQADFEAQLTGENGGAYDNVVSDELASREALRKRNEIAEPDIAGHLKSVGPLKPLKLNAPSEDVVDMGDVDSPEFQAAAQAESAPAPQPLSGQLLPTVISKGGKQLYSSTGPSGRWSPMVQSVFEPFASHENPQIAEAAKSAQSYADKLIHVDGVDPQKAIAMAADQMNKTAGLTVGLERTKLGTRSKWGGGGTPGKFTAMGRKEDTAESIKSYITEARGAVGKLNESDRLLAQAEALANSADPALQRNAIDILVQSRSGATVSDRERARYDQLDGAIAQVQNYVSRWTGGQLDPSYVNKIKMVISEQRRINASTREEVAADLQEAYAAQNEGKVDAPILERRKKALGKVIRRNDDSPAGGDNSDLYE